MKLVFQVHLRVFPRMHVLHDIGVDIHLLHVQEEQTYQDIHNAILS
jgi:hypothetical protein